MLHTKVYVNELLFDTTTDMLTDSVDSFSNSSVNTCCLMFLVVAVGHPVSDSRDTKVS